MSTGSPPLHPVLEPFAFMLGSWRGRGEGSYPTIEDFSYLEEIAFGHVGKPFVAYGQKTRDDGAGLPMHAEHGYFRPLSRDRLEVVMVHPTGILESLVGTVSSSAVTDLILDLRTVSVTGTATAKEVTEVSRRIEVAGDELRYDIAMAAVGQPLTHHLSGTLERSEG